MTCKEKRQAQLDGLKNNSCVWPCDYCIEILNGAFHPWKVFHFDSMEEAKAKYEELEPIYYGGFLRMYAKVTFR